MSSHPLTMPRVPAGPAPGMTRAMVEVEGVEIDLDVPIDMPRRFIIREAERLFDAQRQKIYIFGN